jgi:hypothetical protein
MFKANMAERGQCKYQVFPPKSQPTTWEEFHPQTPSRNAILETHEAKE